MIKYQLERMNEGLPAMLISKHHQPVPPHQEWTKHMFYRLNCADLCMQHVSVQSDTPIRYDTGPNWPIGHDGFVHAACDDTSKTPKVWYEPNKTKGPVSAIRYAKQEESSYFNDMRYKSSIVIHPWDEVLIQRGTSYCHWFLVDLGKKQWKSVANHKDEKSWFGGFNQDWLVGISDLTQVSLILSFRNWVVWWIGCVTNS